jgi:hypothetical protein
VEDKIDPSIARIDAHRARRAAEMMITQSDHDLDQIEDSPLVDFSAMDGNAIIADFSKWQKKFATAPFDARGDKLKFFPGGVTIWSGFPGHGKTTILRQMICHTLKRGSSVFLASLEEDPRTALHMLCATSAGCANPTGHQMQWFIDEFHQRFRLWNLIGVTRHLRLLATIKKLAAEGIRHAFIDSLMLLDVSNTDLDAQREFATLIAALAKSTGVHIHLVAHPRKLISSDQDPDLNDVAGAREIGGIADNVIFIKRPKNQITGPASPVEILIRKQRHGSGYLGEIGMYYRPDWKQLTAEQFTETPIRYLPDDAYLPPGSATVLE